MKNPKRFLTLTLWKQLGPEAGNQAGLWAMFLDCFERRGATFAHIGRLVVNSGAPHCQHLRTRADQVVGELEPVPEGVYPLGPILFASGRWNNYGAKFAKIDSPTSQTIEPVRAIEFHLDGNREWAPGSAGCVVFRTLADLKTYISWADQDPHRFTTLWVNYQLGTIKWPEGLKIPPPPLPPSKRKK